jgi:hypothetical protein
MMTRFFPLAVASLPAVGLALFSILATIEPLGGAGLWPPDEVTLPEAAATRNMGEAARLIGLGHDPNRRGRVRAGMFADGDLQLTPLEAAVWAKRSDVAQLLLESGAVAQGTELSVLRCLTEVQQDSEVRNLLLSLSPDPWPDCRSVPLPTAGN